MIVWLGGLGAGGGSEVLYWPPVLEPEVGGVVLASRIRTRGIEGGERRGGVAVRWLGHGGLVVLGWSVVAD